MPRFTHLSALPDANQVSIRDFGTLRTASMASTSPPDSLRFYRLLASFPWLSSYRAKFVAVLVIAFALPLFIAWLIIVMGAGRMSLLALISVYTVTAAIGCAAAVWAVIRLLAPLDRALDILEAYVDGATPMRLDLPGSDTAAQISRGLSALASRVRNTLMSLWCHANRHIFALAPLRVHSPATASSSSSSSSDLSDKLRSTVVVALNQHSLCELFVADVLHAHEHATRDKFAERPPVIPQRRHLMFQQQPRQQFEFSLRHDCLGVF